MANIKPQLTLQYEYYVMFINTLFDAEAHSEGIVTEQEDIRLCMFLEKTWNDAYLRRWLTARNKMGTPVSETHFLSLIGWIQSHDLFAFGVTKAKLALYLSEHFPTVKDWNEKSMQKNLSIRPSKEIAYRLSLLITKNQGQDVLVW